MLAEVAARDEAGSSAAALASSLDGLAQQAGVSQVIASHC